MRTGTQHTGRPLRASLAGAALALPLLIACPGPRPSAPSDGTTGSRQAAAEWVGARPCATCHADIARGFSRTGMGRALYPLAGNVVERFPETIAVASQDLHYTMFEERGRYYMKQFARDAAGREMHADTRELAYVIGSGNHSRSYVVTEGDRLYQAPVCWYPEPRLWDLCPGYELRNEYFSREVDDTCLFCHNAKVEWAGDHSNRIREPLPHGIDCERCHGPGSLHVERWSSAGETELARSGPAAAGQASGPDAADDTILNPARLPPQRAIQVCMQCHLGDAGQTERVLRRKDHMEGYRAGMELQESLSIHRYESAMPGRFGLGAQADRLALSRCATPSGGVLLCTTCHDPHVEVYEVAAADPRHFDKACAACHDPGTGAGEMRCPDPAAAQGAGCVGCHMARAEPHDQRHTTFTDHWIRRDPRAPGATARQDFAMVPFFADFASHETPAESALYRGRACLNKKQGSVDGAGIDWNTCAEELQEAIRLDPGLAAARLYLGRTQRARGDTDAAVASFEATLRADPHNVEAMQELGSSLLARNELAASRAVLQRALFEGVRSDDRAAVLIELARTSMGGGDYIAARRELMEALETEPLAPEAHANLGLISVLEGNPAAAVGHYEQAVKLAPNEPTIQRLMAAALLEPGPGHDPEAARDAARRATRLAPRDAAAWEALARACDGLGNPGCAQEARGHLRQLMATAQSGTR